MKETFQAKAISIETDQGLQSLALFNDNDQYLFFQCPLEKKDWNNGVYLEFADENQGGYDVISAIDITVRRLQVSLKSPLLGLPDVDTIEVMLEVDGEQLKALANHLQHAFVSRLAEVTVQL